MIHLTLKRAPTVPLEAEQLAPHVLSKLSHDEVCGLPIYHGKRCYRVDEFFDVDGQPSEQLQLTGDLNKVRWIGRGMTSGQIRVQGNVGMHLGAHMRGGEISVDGDAGDWVGAEMKNGTIRVAGNAGGQVGGGYRGSLSGMRNGNILIGGTAGLEIGLRMRRGTILVGGLVRDFAGLQMKGGTLVLLAGAELRAGAWMNRGTIVSLKPLPMMPTFRPSGPCDPTFVRIFARHLARMGVDLPLNGHYQRFTGDTCVPGQGEICIWDPNEA